MLEGVFQAFLPHRAFVADRGGGSGGAALFREENIGIGLGTQRGFTPVQRCRISFIVTEVEDIEHGVLGVLRRQSAAPRDAQAGVNPPHMSSSNQGLFVNYKRVIPKKSSESGILPTRTFVRVRRVAAARCALGHVSDLLTITRSVTGRRRSDPAGSPRNRPDGTRNRPGSPRNRPGSPRNRPGRWRPACK